jgi:hypothetical protein
MYHIDIIVNVVHSSRYADRVKFDKPFFKYQYPELFLADTNTHTLLDCLEKNTSLIINDPIQCAINSQLDFAPDLVKQQIEFLSNNYHPPKLFSCQPVYLLK